ncbi:MAG: RNA polymerase factor sigma-54 [Acidobacteria bacterium]|nr:RNA polymerase factor sigma-54 [Acidobacteriota bacterium]
MSSLRLTHQLQQKMVLTPQLRQRIEMLQMTSLELNELIEQQMVENPVLEEVQPGDEVQEIGENILDQNSNGAEDGLENGADRSADAVSEARTDQLAQVEGVEPEGVLLNGNAESPELDGDDDVHPETADSFDEIDYGREFQDYLDPGYRTQEIEYKEDAPSFEQFLTQSENLAEHLEWQVHLLDLSSTVEKAAIEIIGNLDEDGRLTATLEDISQACGCSAAAAEQARQAIMQLDPVGCAAYDVKECLLSQIATNGGDGGLAARLIKDYLEDLQPHRLQHLSKATGIDVHVLDDVIKDIRRLDPYPGRRFSSEEAIYVAPEVYIEKVDDDYVVFFADDGSPRLRISPTYHSMLGQPETSKETKDFIKDKVRSAIDLLRNIEHRRQTIYRVVECIVSRQRDFLDKGVEYIKPMMLKDIAEDIGMHLSTISRVVNRKYAHTPQGVIELRRFFSEGMLNEEGEEVSTRILKLKIKRMIEEEDTKSPLTDDQIAKVLSKEGVKLSRRTVAKYRDQMNIAGSRERKTII